ncbi:epoxide hydrolase [Microbacterium pumilum]|uniref:Epoxide hydrolase n=1 Tax=Microbacterium pumilum TaxID=344165 RepID=A0ABP5EB53_9MICO
MTTSSWRPAPIHVGDDVLDDLRDRLHATRWPQPLPRGAWEAGVDLSVVREACRVWADEFDWRAQERWLNALDPHFAHVDGLDLHVFRAASASEDGMPLLLLHGWPGSVVEFRHVIRTLTQGSPAFELVIPSLPGFGFGGKPAESGWGVTRSAEAFHALMTDVLGHERYGVQGGDWGAIIGSRLAQLHPDAVVGLHTNYPLSASDIDQAWAADATPLEREYLAHLAAYATTERGYSAIQSTKPQTLAVAQTDSPAGLAAWILEKFETWSDRGSSGFDVEDLLTNLMFYWAPDSVASSAAMYFESRLDPEGRSHPVPDVPVGVANFPHEITRITRRWAEPKYRIAHWTDMPHGGHFAALEEPVLLADDIRAFFASRG